MAEALWARSATQATHWGSIQFGRLQGGPSPQDSCNWHTDIKPSFGNFFVQVPSENFRLRLFNCNLKDYIHFLQAFA
jgi:hypothetical protein